MLLKILQNSQGNICGRVSLLFSFAKKALMSKQVNPFDPNALVLYFLKTSENLKVISKFN